MRYATPFFSMLLLAGLYTSSFAQGFQGGGHFLIGLPQGEFDQNIQGAGFGGSLFGGFTFAPAPIMLGLEGSAMIYGRETRNEPLSTTIPDITVDVITTNTFFSGHTFLRLQPQSGLIRPYVDGLIGFNHLRTETTVEDEDDFDEEPIFSSTNAHDTGFSYGAGGGLMIKLADSVDDDGDPFDVLLDIRVRYLIGGEVEYLKEGSIRRFDGQVEFDTIRSKTDALFIHVGVVVQF